MKTALRMTAIALTLGVVGVATAEAQTNNASVQATATVQQPINVTGARDLAFGNVFPGVNQSVAVTDPNSGLWSVTGQVSGNVQLTFGLPATLSDGTNTMPIGTYVGHWNQSNSPVGGTGFTPSAGSTNAQLHAVTGEAYVFIGATVSPATNQPAGTYSGTLSMTVVYF
jgi:spore coat protein U-like protein